MEQRVKEVKCGKCGGELTQSRSGKNALFFIHAVASGCYSNNKRKLKVVYGREISQKVSKTYR